MAGSLLQARLLCGKGACFIVSQRHATGVNGSVPGPCGLFSFREERRMLD